MKLTEREAWTYYIIRKNENSLNLLMFVSIKRFSKYKFRYLKVNNNKRQIDIDDCFVINIETLVIGNNCKLSNNKQLRLKEWIKNNYFILNQLHKSKMRYVNFKY